MINQVTTERKAVARDGDGNLLFNVHWDWWSTGRRKWQQASVDWFSPEYRLMGKFVTSEWTGWDSMSTKGDSQWGGRMKVLWLKNVKKALRAVTALRQDAQTNGQSE